MNIACSRTPPLDSFVRPPFPVRRRTVAEYEELTRRGLLTAVDKVELLEGWIVPKMTRNPPHSSTIQCLIDELCQFLRTRWKLRIQSATCTADSVPEPDVAVVAGPAGRIDNQNATVVEVADATLRQDRKKREIYASAGIPVYWIVNLKRRMIEVYTDPDAAGRKYAADQAYAAGESAPVIVGGKVLGAIPVAQLLPSKGSS